MLTSCPVQTVRDCEFQESLCLDDFEGFSVAASLNCPNTTTLAFICTSSRRSLAWPHIDNVFPGRYREDSWLDLQKPSQQLTEISERLHFHIKRRRDQKCLESSELMEAILVRGWTNKRERERTVTMCGCARVRVQFIVYRFDSKVVG